MQTETSACRPFRSYCQVLAYVNEKNPARAKFASRFEPEATRSTLVIDDFSGDSPRDIFASALGGIATVLRRYSTIRAQAWCLRNLGSRGKDRSVQRIAELLHVRCRSVYRWLDRIDDAMIEEFQRRELLQVSK